DRARPGMQAATSLDALLWCVADRDPTTKLLPGDADGAVSLLVIAGGPPIVVPLAIDREIRIGRGSTADLALDESSLSRLHAKFRLRDGFVEVEDLASSNGTTVRGKKIAPGSPVRVELGEAVHLGSVLVVVQFRSGSVADRLRPAAAGPTDELVARI